MKQKTITGILLAIVLVPLVLLGGIPIIILGILLGTIGSFELIRMHINKRGLDKKYQYIMPIFTLIMLIIIGLKMIGINIEIMYIICSFILLSIILMIISILNKNILMSDVIYFIFSMIYPGILIMLIINIRLIDITPEVSIPENYYYDGLLVFLYLIITTICTDIFAQVIGLKYGKHKLCPSISPKKSIEGSIGGSIVSTILGSLFLILCIHFNYVHIIEINSIWNILLIILVTLVLSILGQFGDLIASRLKREYGIKDFGNIFPGHGGVMDRFDSLLISGTALFIILTILGVL